MSIQISWCAHKGISSLGCSYFVLFSIQKGLQGDETRISLQSFVLAVGRLRIRVWSPSQPASRVRKKKFNHHLIFKVKATAGLPLLAPDKHCSVELSQGCDVLYLSNIFLIKKKSLMRNGFLNISHRLAPNFWNWFLGLLKKLIMAAKITTSDSRIRQLRGRN